MTDKSKSKDPNPIAEFASTFVSDPKVVKDPADFADYDGFHLTPLDDLVNDDDESNHKE